MKQIFGLTISAELVKPDTELPILSPKCVISKKKKTAELQVPIFFRSIVGLLSKIVVVL